ncbi:hypothetical protein GCM10010294_47250 [Streptomyces griseoloalbus]|nr:hypothetical protein GCM10010294_47250 [Streptomyces griseoloalbus]
MRAVAGFVSVERSPGADVPPRVTAPPHAPPRPARTPRPALTNPATQIEWGLDYMKDRYGSACDAWSFWQSNGWY